MAMPIAQYHYEKSCMCQLALEEKDKNATHIFATIYYLQLVSVVCATIY
jgi:hypothetical protein